MDDVVHVQIIKKKFKITFYAEPLLYNPVSTEVLHLCYKVSRVYSFFCNIILPLNTLLLSPLTWNEILPGAVIPIPQISCAHTHPMETETYLHGWDVIC